MDLSSMQNKSSESTRVQLRIRVAERFRNHEISFDRAMYLIAKIRQCLSREPDGTLSELHAAIEANDHTIVNGDSV